VQRDPDYALAHAGLAVAYATLGTYTPEPPADVMEGGRAAAMRALELDGDISDAHTALGFIALCYDWSWARADEAFRRATELNPRNATAWQWHSLLYLVTGNDAEALRLVTRAEEIEPTSLIIRSHVAWTLYYSRRFHDAVDRLEQILQWDRRFWRVYFNVGWCYGQLGRHAQALTAMQTCVALNDYPAARAALAHAYARAGRVHEARQIVQELLTQQAYVSQYWLGLTYMALQETAAALRCLQHAYEHREWFLILLKREPLFDPLRSDSTFIRLVADIGL
jgi:tetratricopeptide (TPR) repeat protein